MLPECEHYSVPQGLLDVIMRAVAYGMLRADPAAGPSTSEMISPE